MAQKVKRKRDSEDTKRRLVKAAVEVFSKVGYDAASTRMVANRAGVNLSLIQRYFASKLGLLLSAIDHVKSAEDDCAASYPKGKDLEEELMNFFDSRIKDMKDKKKFIKIIISRAIVDRKVGDVMKRHVAEGGMAGLISRFEELRKEGKIRTDIELQPTCSVVSGLAFAIGFFGGIVFQMDENYIRPVLTAGSKILAQGLKPK
jgi:TetR/AcrR family transcriptional regulator, regulator of cefoperazone and chloramphenicol sensitivity